MPSANLDIIDKRQEERVSAVLPVTLQDCVGTTRDVSASGMFFETSARLAPGDKISFSVEFDTPSGKRMLKCWGDIVRTEIRDPVIGVAVRIIESTMGHSA
jgi:hypothetical protein